MADGPGWLFVPADRPERFAKAAASSDQVIIDLEDAVRGGAKAEAREKLLHSGDIDVGTACVRINGFGTSFVVDDLETIRALGITKVMVPMAEEGQPFECLGGCDVIALIETARGVATAEQVAKHPQVGALALGSADLEVDLRMRRRAASAGGGIDPIGFARTSVLFAARAYGIEVIDSALASVADEARLQAEAETACAYGFDGKLAIHPRQVDIIRLAFSPTADEDRWANAVVEAAANRPEGAFVLDGELIDDVMIRRAGALLRLG